MTCFKHQADKKQKSKLKPKIMQLTMIITFLSLAIRSCLLLFILKIEVKNSALRIEIWSLRRQEVRNPQSNIKDTASAVSSRNSIFNI
jgi:hypothetical protein